MQRQELLEVIRNNKLITRFLDMYFDSYSDLKYISEGHENVSYSFRAKNELYVLRISKPEKESGRLYKEIGFINYLDGNNIPVPRVIVNLEDKYVSEIRAEDRIFRGIVMRKMKGENPKEYSDKLVGEIGHWMAKLHLSSAEYKQSTLNKVEIEKEYFMHNEIDIKEVRSKSIKVFLQEAKDFEWDISKLPQGVVHTDFHKNNLLVQNDEITGILDFDDITHSAFVLDLGVMINNIVFGYLFKDTSLDRIDILLEAYETVRILNQEERDNLRNAALFRSYGLAAFFYWIDDFDLLEYVQIRDVIQKININ